MFFQKFKKHLHLLYSTFSKMICVFLHWHWIWIWTKSNKYAWPPFSPFVCLSICMFLCLSVGCPAMRERPFERESNLNLNRFRFLFFWPSQTSRKCFEDRTRFENTWKTYLRVSKRYWSQFKYFGWLNKIVVIIGKQIDNSENEEYLQCKKLLLNCNGCFDR